MTGPSAWSATRTATSPTPACVRSGKSCARRTGCSTVTGTAGAARRHNTVMAAAEDRIDLLAEGGPGALPHLSPDIVDGLRELAIFPPGSPPVTIRQRPPRPLRDEGPARESNGPGRRASARHGPPRGRRR